jgi:pimeloyl-ACP methyl ester carboxylesterase
MAIVAAAELGVHCRALITEFAQVFAESRTFEGVRQARAIFAPGTVSYERLKKYHGDKTDWALSAWIDSWLDPAFADFTLASDLHRVTCPVLAIHGDRDEYGTPAHARMICDMAAGPSTLHVFPGLGHVPHREQPEAVLAAIARTLS